jgi:hypothetical protein
LWVLYHSFEVRLQSLRMDDVFVGPRIKSKLISTVQLAEDRVFEPRDEFELLTLLQDDEVARFVVVDMEYKTAGDLLQLAKDRFGVEGPEEGEAVVSFFHHSKFAAVCSQVELKNHSRVVCFVVHGEIMTPVVLGTSGDDDIARFTGSMAAFVVQNADDLKGARSLEEVKAVVCKSRVLPEWSFVFLHDIAPENGVCSGILGDLKRRLKFYWLDWKDGCFGPKHMQKSVSASLFLYCVILFPTLALGEALAVGTGGVIAIQQAMYMQVICGVGFAIFGGQPLTIVMTTAPFTLFSSLLYGIAQNLQVPFLPLYAWTGLFCAFYCVVVAVLNLSSWIRFFTLFTEEAFAFFIAASFVFGATKACVEFFNVAYFSPFNRSSAVLYLFLLLLMPFVSLSLRRIRSSALFGFRVREAISDFALVIGVLVCSFFGTFVFRCCFFPRLFCFCLFTSTSSVSLPPFTYNPNGRVFVIAQLLNLPGWAIGASSGFGFVLALLLVIDQSISSAMAQTPSMQTKKGPAYHWDLLVVAGFCVISALFGFPFVNASVPQAPMHTLALADVQVHRGRVSVVYARGESVLSFFLWLKHFLQKPDLPRFAQMHCKGDEKEKFACF